MSVAIPVTLLYGGLNALLVTLLGLWVSLLRIWLRVYGVKPVPAQLLRPIRRHGNAAEWVPLAILLLLLLELTGRVGSFWLHLAGGTFLFGRLVHALGFARNGVLSTAGATVTYVVVGALCLGALWLHFVP